MRGPSKECDTAKSCVVVGVLKSRETIRKVCRLEGRVDGRGRKRSKREGRRAWAAKQGTKGLPNNDGVNLGRNDCKTIISAACTKARYGANYVRSDVARAQRKARADYEIYKLV